MQYVIFNINTNCAYRPTTESLAAAIIYACGLNAGTIDKPYRVAPSTSNVLDDMKVVPMLGLFSTYEEQERVFDY